MTAYLNSVICFNISADEIVDNVLAHGRAIPRHLSKNDCGHRSVCGADTTPIYSAYVLANYTRRRVPSVAIGPPPYLLF